MNKRSNEKIRIMCFGTFDILHQGHLNFFKQARALSKNPFLTVSVARDINVKKIKGHKPINSEKKRLAIIRSTKLVDKAVLGGIKNYLSHIVKESPRIIALGYDQLAFTGGLKQKLTKLGLNVRIKRLKAYKKYLYKTSVLNKVI